MDKRELEHQRDLERIKNLRLIDDDFLKKVFADKRCVRLVLRIIMEMPDLEVKSVHTEYEVYNLYGRSIRVDILAEDSKGKLYNIEIQRADKGANPKRARFNSSLIDANTLKKGNDFDALPESYVIFITENDVLERGLPIYHIDRIIRETGEVFEDKSHIIYVNNEIRNDTELGRLMNDFIQTDADKIHYKDLAEEVRYFKESERGVSSMCKALEEMRNEAREEGMKQGLADGMKQGLADGMKQGLADGMKQGLADGMKQGLADGMKQGLADGRKQGLADGRKQGLAEKTRRIAFRMIKKNNSDAEIIDLTEISAEELRLLREEYKKASEE